MKYVPKGQRKEWHEKAIEAAMGADLHSIVEGMGPSGEPSFPELAKASSSAKERRAR
jgi:hypothetical protein